MNDRSPHLTVRVKLVDLDYTGCPSPMSVPRSSVAPVPALVGSETERGSILRPVSVETTKASENHTGEICLRSGKPVSFSDFENHLETCTTCSNRVELQLDFIETLEVSMYQHKSLPHSPRMTGALLISAPKLNFAICGEMDI